MAEPWFQARVSLSHSSVEDQQVPVAFPGQLMHPERAALSIPATVRGRCGAARLRPAILFSRERSQWCRESPGLVGCLLPLSIGFHIPCTTALMGLRPPQGFRRWVAFDGSLCCCPHPFPGPICPLAQYQVVQTSAPQVPHPAVKCPLALA